MGHSFILNWCFPWKPATQMLLIVDMFMINTPVSWATAASDSHPFLCPHTSVTLKGVVPWSKFYFLFNSWFYWLFINGNILHFTPTRFQLGAYLLVTLHFFPHKFQRQFYNSSHDPSSGTEWLHMQLCDSYINVTIPQVPGGTATCQCPLAVFYFWTPRFQSPPLFTVRFLYSVKTGLELHYPESC